MTDTVMQPAPAAATGNVPAPYPVNGQPTPTMQPAAPSPATQALPALAPVTQLPAAEPAVDEWAQCEKCEKWRRVFGGVDVNKLPDNWTCDQNTWDAAHSNCAAPSEEEEQVDAEQAYLAQLQLQQQQTKAQAMQQSVEISRALEEVLFENKQPIAWPGINSEYTSEAAKRRFYYKLWNVHNRTTDPYPRTKEPTPRPIDLYQVWRCAEIAGGVDQIDMAEWRTLWYCSDVTEYPGSTLR